jgi:hypothetical protein
MKNHTFVMLDKKLSKTHVYKCNVCGSFFVYPFDSLYTLAFDRYRNKAGINENCDVELVKNSITS